MPAKMVRGTAVRGDVEQDARRERADEDDEHETRERAHPVRTAAMAGRVKGESCFSGSAA
jgi:hypothetical protein